MYSDRDFELIEVTEKSLNFYKNNVDRNKDYMCVDDVLYISYYKD